MTSPPRPSFLSFTFLSLSVGLSTLLACADIEVPDQKDEDSGSETEDSEGNPSGAGGTTVITSSGGATTGGVPQPMLPEVPETPETPETPEAPSNDCEPACTGDLVCNAGACGCALGQDQCGDACTSFDTDINNCGDCEQTCEGATPYCTSGSCSECEIAEEFNCDGSCTDVSDDPTNCGECGRTCDTGAGEECEAGECELRGTCALPDIANYTGGSCGARTVYGGALYECASSNIGSCGTTGVFCQTIAPDSVPWGSTAWTKIQDCP